MIARRRERRRTATCSWCARWCPPWIELVPRLVQADIAVRELAPVVSPLETAFLALTEAQESTEQQESADDRDAPSPPPPPRRPPAPVPVARAFRFELVKQLAQWRVRLLILACWIGPAVAVVVGQRAEPRCRPTPSSAAEMRATGWAGALVVLAFAAAGSSRCSPRSSPATCSPPRTASAPGVTCWWRSARRAGSSLAKALASLTVLLMCVPGLAVSGIVGGAGGRQPAAGRSRRPQLAPATPPGSCCSRGSACSPRSSPSPRSGCSGPSSSGAPRSACCCPPSAGWACRWRRRCCRCRPPSGVALPSYAFLSWNGLFTSPPQLGPLIVGIAVSLAWAVVATALAYRLFMRRDFTDLAHDGSVRRAIALGDRCRCSRVWALSAVGGGRGDRGHGLRHRPGQGAGVAGDDVRPPLRAADQRAAPACGHRGAAAGHRVLHKGGPAWSPTTGPATTGAASSPGTPRRQHGVGQAIYQLDVSAERAVRRRRRRTEGGQRLLPGAHPVRDAPNPLWQFDGLVDLLSPTSKG